MCCSKFEVKDKEKIIFEKLNDEDVLVDLKQSLNRDFYMLKKDRFLVLENK